MARKTLFIGITSLAGRPATPAEIGAQIDAVKALLCDLTKPSGAPLDWLDFDNPADPDSMFQYILREHTGQAALASSRAFEESAFPFAVITARDGRAVRLEYFEHIERRAKSLYGRRLRSSLERLRQSS